MMGRGFMWLKTAMFATEPRPSESVENLPRQVEAGDMRRFITQYVQPTWLEYLERWTTREKRRGALNYIVL